MLIPVLSRASAHGCSQLKHQKLRVGGYTKEVLEWSNYLRHAWSLCRNAERRRRLTRVRVQREAEQPHSCLRRSASRCCFLRESSSSRQCHYTCILVNLQVYLTQSEEVCWTTSHLLFSDIMQPHWEPDLRRRCSWSGCSVASESEPSDTRVSPTLHVLLLKRCSGVARVEQLPGHLVGGYRRTDSRKFRTQPQSTVLLAYTCL